MKRHGRLSRTLLWAVGHGYTVDRSGAVFLPNGKLCRQRLIDGYWTITAGPGNGNERGAVRVHKLIGYFKYGEAIFADGLVLRHRDNNARNNTWDNVVIGTQSQNMLDRPLEDRRLHAQRAADTKRVLDDDGVAQLKADRATGMTYSQLRAKYGLAKSSISCILHRGGH